MKFCSQFLLLLLASSPLAAQAPEAGPVPRQVDQYGDTLPEGAVRRFGSLRLRHPQLWDFVVLDDGTTAVTGGDDGTIRRWDLNTGKQTSLVSIAKEGQYRPTLSADGKVAAILSGLYDRTLEIIDTGSGHMSAIFPIRKTDVSDINCLVISADGRRVAIGGSSNRFILIDVKTNRMTLFMLASGRQEMEWPPPKLVMTFSPDGRRLAVGGGDTGRVVAMATDTGEELFAREARAVSVAFLPTTDKLAFVERLEDNRHETGYVLRVFDIASGKMKYSSTVSRNALYAFLTASPDGRRLALSEEKETVVFDARTGRVIRQMQGGADWHGNGTVCRFTPDGARLILKTGPRLFVRDVATGKAVGNEDAETEFAEAAVSPDGRWLAVQNIRDGALELWDSRSARLARTLTEPCDRLEDIVFSGDSRAVIAVTLHKEIRKWDTKTGRRIPMPADALEGARGVLRLTPDGRSLVSFGNDEKNDRLTRFEMFDTTTGRLKDRATIDGIGGDEKFMFDSILPDNESAVFFNRNDKECRITGLRTGKERLRLFGEVFDGSKDGRWLVFSPDELSEHGKRHFDILEATSGSVMSAYVASDYLDAECHASVHIRGRMGVILEGNRMRAVDLATNQELKTWTLPKSSYGAPNHGLGRRIFNGFLGRDMAMTSFDDGTALTWDLSACRFPQLSDTHAEADLAKWWDDLAGEGPAAYAAIWKLAESPEDTLIPFLRQRLRPIAPPSATEWKGLMAALDHQEFRVRAAALRRLEQYGIGALSLLTAERRKVCSAEKRERLEQLTARLTGPVPNNQTLRFLRALAALEETNTREARRLVETLGAGMPAAPETKAAIATLARMRIPARINGDTASMTKPASRTNARMNAKPLRAMSNQRSSFRMPGH
ncbi:WD40 repeat domain-containing protein [Zavarzinella formosa]|uniref:WD40 repeat domain-containing protein n=1 Tax=Zavarzinella formosa TaxID=360055 RepID=UPI00030DF1E4|nr:WD40 repeat domain-containing protein [Zavarzinella formosa]